MTKYRWESELRERYPIPDTSGIKNYYFSLDGGGRKLVTEIITRENISVMIEIGCFLCGSTIDWLKTSSHIKVIGIDHWNLDIEAILERYQNNPVFDPCFSKISHREEFIKSSIENGAFKSAMANIKQFSTRFFPVREKSPEALYVLYELGINPGLIYIDSDKVMGDLDVCRKLFPDAILCGDDWTWGEHKGFPVQKAVQEFCKRTNSVPLVDLATWVITNASNA